MSAVDDVNLGGRFKKHFKPAFEYADANGWALKRTAAGHIKWSKPNRKAIHSSASPSCQHAYKNVLADLIKQDKINA